MTTLTDASPLASLPSAEHITLLLKSHKQTVLLSVLPTTAFPEIKSLLLLALQSRNITSIDDTPIPSDSDAIEFGVLRNRKNPAEGWVALEIKELDVNDTTAKGGKRKIGGKKSVLNESPAGAGLGDGSMLAFRFKTKNDEGKEKVKAEAEGEDWDLEANEDGEDDEMEIEPDPGWNVILPSYDDEEID